MKNHEIPGIDDSNWANSNRFITLKRSVGGWISPKDFWMLAVLSGIELWLSNLQLIIIFGVYNNWKIKIFGVLDKIFQKFAFEKFFS